MDSRQIICIVVTISIIFENANASNESNTKAFIHALENVDNTNAKGPKDFCYETKPGASQIPTQIIDHLIFTSNQQHHQRHAREHEQPTFNLNLQPSMSIPPIYSDEYSSFGRSQAGTSTSDMDSDISIGLDLNKLPPEYRNEHLALDSNQQYYQPHAQQNEQRNYDLSLPPPEFTPPVYPGEYPFNFNQTKTYISYVDSDKCLGFNLNELPPAESEENEKVEGNV